MFRKNSIVDDVGDLRRMLVDVEHAEINADTDDSERYQQSSDNPYRHAHGAREAARIRINSSGDYIE